MSTQSDLTKTASLALSIGPGGQQKTLHSSGYDKLIAEPRKMIPQSWPNWYYGSYG